MLKECFKSVQKALAAAVFTFLAWNVSALEVPALTGRVVDNAKIITSGDESEITSYLEDLENKTGIQIAVLTVKSLEGESLEAYSMKVCEKWKLGQKDKDNGALLFVALAERKVRIEVGYGLEGSLTDTKCGLIIRNVIIPEFQAGDYSDGILKAVKNMAGIAGNNEELVSGSVKSTRNSGGTTSVLFGFLFVFGWFILFSGLAVGRQNHFLPWLIFSSAFRSSHPYNGSGFSSFGSDHDSFGGFGGGGFSGGGGGFGGGGASGGW